MLENVEVQAEIERRKALRNEKAQIDAQWVLDRLKTLELADVRELFDDDGNLKSLADLPEPLTHVIAGIDVLEKYEGHGKDRRLVGYTKRVRFIDRVRVTELIGKHVTVSAFSENVHLQNADDLGQRINEARARAMAAAKAMAAANGDDETRH